MRIRRAILSFDLACAETKGGAWIKGSKKNVYHSGRRRFCILTAIPLTLREFPCDTNPLEFEMQVLKQIYTSLKLSPLKRSRRLQMPLRCFLKQRRCTQLKSSPQDLYILPAPSIPQQKCRVIFP